MRSDWLDYWNTYRKTTGKLTWRLARGADTFEIERLRLTSERYLSHSQRRPSLFQFPVMLALVAENEKGEIVDLLYVETQVEVIKVGLSSVGLEEAAGLEDDLGEWLKDLKFTTAIATCPPSLKQRMGAFFVKMGFWPQNDGLIRYRRWL